MYRETIIAIGAGSVSALLSIAVTVGSGLGILLAYFTLLPILLIGLGKNRRALTFASLSGICSTVALSNIFQGMLYSVSIALPAWLIILTALAPKKNNFQSPGAPIGEIMSRLTILGGIMMILVTITFFEQSADLPQNIENFLKKLIVNNQPDLTTTVNGRLLVEKIVLYFPAITVSSWLLMAIINSLVAQSILIRAGANLTPAFRYSEITAPDRLYWALVGSGVLVLLGTDSFEYLGRNLTVIVCIPFLFVGLGVLHTAARQLRSPTIALVVFYFFLIVLSWPAIIAVLIGFFEKWTKFRDKLTSNGPKDNINSD